MTIDLDYPSTPGANKTKSRTLKVTANGVPNDVNETVYVQSLKLNGKSLG